MKRVRRILFRTALCVVIALMLALAIGAWLLKSDPSWYRRLHLTDAQQAAAEKRLLDRLAILRNSVGLAEAATRQASANSAGSEWPAFEIEITEDEVNGPLTRWTQAGPFAQWANENPDVRAALDQVQEPHVRFLPGRIELAGRSTSLGSLVSIELGVEQPKTGPPLVTLGRPWAGRMPLARSIIQDPALRGIAALRRGEGADVPPTVIDAAESLVEGKPTAPTIIISSSTEGSGLLAARIERLVIEEGILRATLRPIGQRR